MGETFYIVIEVSNGRRTEFSTLDDAEVFAETLRESSVDDAQHGIKCYIYKANKITTYIF